jgi:asparagine synthetase B (glutamine-hydrolysing)
MNHWREVLSLPIVAPVTHPCDLDQLEQVLLQANRECALECARINGGEIALCLSGGLDSSLSAAMIRRSFPSADIATYTIGSADDHPDVVHAELVARHFALASHVQILGQTGLAAATEQVEKLFGREHCARFKGTAGVLALYQQMEGRNVGAVIAHDGIDELLGGYWAHRASVAAGEQEAQAVFADHWRRLQENHLRPLEVIAQSVGIKVLFPYLQREVVEEITAIPLVERTSRAVSKLPLRELAERNSVPDTVIQRRKRGFCDALTPVDKLSE